jgi:hypothetical protein
VVRLAYRPVDDDRPSSNNLQLISRCQDSVRQSISENRINIGGLFDVALQSGRRIDFLEGAQVQPMGGEQDRVTGEAIVSQGSRERRVSYECTAQKGQITSTNFR